jgi:hypothetical protein
MPKDSRYWALNHRVDVIKNRGFDYRGRTYLKSMDKNLLKNSKIRGFIVKLEEIVNEWFYQVKRIKTHFNYIVEADSDVIN